MSFIGSQGDTSAPHYGDHYQTGGSGQPARKSSAYCYQGSGSYPDSHSKEKRDCRLVRWEKERTGLRPSKGLQDLNDKLIAMQEERERRIDIYTDSLRIQNKALNRKLQILITHLDGQAQAAFISREEKITEAGDFSFKLFVLVIVSASSLLFISFLIIRHDIRKEREGRAQLQRINRENEELLGMRKQIILTISHDIRGPLGNINNCVELASETVKRKNGKLSGEHPPFLPPYTESGEQPDGCL